MRAALPVSQGKPVLQGAPVFRGIHACLGVYKSGLYNEIFYVRVRHVHQPGRDGVGSFWAQVWTLGTAEGTVWRVIVPPHVLQHGRGHVLPQKRDPARAKGPMRYARALIRR